MKHYNLNAIIILTISFSAGSVLKNKNKTIVVICIYLFCVL